MKNYIFLGAMLFSGVLVQSCRVLDASEYEHGKNGHEMSGEYKHSDGRDDKSYKGEGYPSGAGSTMFKKECSECHFAYQPWLLPAQSWREMMSERALQDHFGEDLAYDAAKKKELLDYMMANSAEKSSSRLARKMASSVGSSGSYIISETSYIKREHDEIPDYMITGNKDVKTLGNCTACHKYATQGDYEEHGVQIPGYPGYDD